MNEIIINLIISIVVGVLGFINKKKHEEQAKAIKKVEIQNSTVEKRITNIFNEIKNQFNITIENDTRKVDQMLKDFANLKAHLNERIGTQVQLDLDIKQCLLLLTRCESKLKMHTAVLKSHHRRLNEMNLRLDIIMPVKNHSSK